MRRYRRAFSRALVVAAIGSAAFTVSAVPAAADPSYSASASAASSAPMSTCATLDQGTTGAAVATVQQLVGATADGDFGPQTAAALEKWQTAAGIPATEVLDAATWAAMPAATAATVCSETIGGSGFTAGCAVLSQGDTGPAVATLENALKLSEDGQFTASTGQALAAAQQAGGLPATSTTSRKTWKLLGLTGTPVCTPGSTTPALPKDYQQQQAVRKHVAQLAAALLDQPGTTTNKIALAAVAFAKQQDRKSVV